MSRKIKVTFSLLTLCFASVYGQAEDAHGKPTLRQGTPVYLELDQTLNSATARMGERVAFQVSGDVKLGEHVVIPAGSLALGTVAQVLHRNWIGRRSRLDVIVDTVRLPGGQVVPLSTSPDMQDEGRGTANDSIATSLVPLAVSPRTMSAHRKDVLIPEGTTLLAYVRHDTVLARETTSASNEVAATESSSK